MNAAVPAPTWEAPSKPEAVLKPYYFSHGTAESLDINKSREFYEEFLGLNCVRIAPEALAVTVGVRFHIVIVGVRDDYPLPGMYNHWGLQLGTREEVEQAYEKAVELKDKFGIREIIAPTDQAWGALSFYLQDRDGNWWEIEYYPGNMTDDFFALGDML